MILSIDDARKLLGEDADKFSDESIEQMIKGFDLIADIVIDQHLKEKE